MLDLPDGGRLRLLLDRDSAQAIAETLTEELAAPQRNTNLPHWVISSLIPQDPGSSAPGQLQVPPASSSTATMGDA
jgi:hypothetical protein